MIFLAIVCGAQQNDSDDVRCISNQSRPHVYIAVDSCVVSNR